MPAREGTGYKFRRLAGGNLRFSRRLDKIDQLATEIGESIAGLLGKDDQVERSILKAAQQIRRLVK